MTPRPYTDQFLRQRKFYLVLPLLAIPFLTFIYWKLLVRNLDKPPAENPQGTGLQLSLPTAELKGEQNMDKLAYYRKADQDSASWAQQIKKDPYRQGEYRPVVDSTNSALMGLSSPGLKPGHVSTFQAGSGTKQEKQLHQRLRALDKAIAASHVPAFENQEPGKDTATESKPDISRLEKMMAQMQSQDPADGQDPEMNRLDGMLDKLLQLQQQENLPAEPDDVKDANQSRDLPVHAVSSDDPISLLAAHQDSSAYRAGEGLKTGFYGLDQQDTANTESGLTAVIDHTQQLVSGNTVQLRLTKALSVASAQITANTFVYGTASLSGERLKIKISSIRSGDLILPVSLSVYDLDGNEGIFIPGAMPRTVAKQQLSSQVQGYDLDAGGFSVGAQAASAGIQMGKMLLSRKTRLTQITLREGYKVLLYETNTTNR
ncbi:conjugative transposon protein TraM [Dyadobacter endophyticus]|uniref:Conjugative transposon protein TraM n=1 Tax=Dyadobacter endophyticus TaxID=1749036 RepID=A0ABQ1YDA2_9BACT|nr:conjugative transposon protein TraM [Dyadobacter endophyticus]GGH20281.1 conjugative transposon protein TraM [Dyadobacter endophyticus]